MKSPLMVKNLHIITKFEKMGSFNACSGRGRETVPVEGKQKVAFQVEGGKVSSHLYQYPWYSRSGGYASFNCPKHHAEYHMVLSIQVSTCA